MFISEISNAVKIVIITLAVLAAPLATDGWAKSERSRGEGSGKSERSERSERSRATSSVQRNERQSSQQRTVSPAPRQRQEVREAPRSEAPQQRISQNRQERNSPPVSRQPSFERRQPELSNPAPTIQTPPAARQIDSVRNPGVRPQRSDAGSGIFNRGQRADNSRETFRQKPENVIQPLARTTEVRKDDSRRDSPVFNQRDNKEQSGSNDRIVRNSRDNDRGKQENTRITDGRSERSERTESRTLGQTRNFSRDWSVSRNRAVRDNDSDRRDFVRSSRNTVQLRQDRDDIIRLRHTSIRGVVYEDRSRTFGTSHRYDHSYSDRHNRWSYRIISPRYYFPLYYDWGYRHSVRFVYPYYHRRYVFVSLGGFWPDYSCVRYYWYPSHSYVWYGYDPVAQEISNDTYNYYTYNYYNTQPEYSAATDTSGIATVDETTFADVREKLARQQALEPAVQTDADTLFDEGVNAFEQGSYAEAEEKFARAMAIAPDDLILPFAYAQALLAQGKYAQSAEILRVVVQKSTPDKQGVFFPRGLYLDENTLDSQIDRLAETAANNPADTDIQLLLGYQLLGIGESNRAIESLNRANLDGRNLATVTVLYDLAEKIESGETR